MSHNSNTTSSLTDKVLQLPDPSKPLSEEFVTETYTFTITPKTTIKELKTVLGNHGRTKSGNRQQLIDRLVDFANKTEEWIGQYQARPKRKRGEITGGRTHSAKRVALMFGENEAAVGFPNKQQGVDQRAIKPPTEISMMLVDNWTDEVLEWCTNVDRRADRPANSIEAPSSNVADSSDVGPGISMPPEEDHSYQAVSIRRMQRQLTQLERNVFAKLDDIADRKSVDVSERAHSTISIRSDTVGNTQPDRFVSGPTPSLDLAVSAGSQRTIPTEHLRTVLLDDEPLTFDKRQVPDPPLRHFSDSLSELFSEWEKGTILKVSGTLIPLKSWPVIYQRRIGVKCQAWELLKVTWGNWKFIVEEKDDLGSEDAFWAKYTYPDGTRASYQQILDRLKTNRGERDAIDAAAARTYFGGNLACADANGLFLYKKKGALTVCTKDEAVAKKWRDLLHRD
ncbi:hypothetical protein A0H81_06902 [Grifola frondosa]|uniref:SAP domain-containing protein n=1 Tax=Grifola frondosa TaxID=5627 RepID=A0A1C7MCM9_GRIFR|nr:hypothetical protein A0H81_06902 [Grifola frondosa]